MRDYLAVACYTLAAGILAVAGILAYRIIWPAREPRTEPVSPAGTTTRPGPLWLRLVPTRRDATATGPAPTTPGDPDETDEPAREDSGADDAFVDDLRAMRVDLDEHPGFTSEVPVVEAPEFDYHAALNALEDAFHHDVEHFWDWAYDRLGVDPLTRLRLPSAIEQTGEIDRAELDAMLEGIR